MRNAIVFAALMLLVLAPSCAHNRFVSHSQKHFHSFTLSNGIPVYVNSMPHSRTLSLVCTLQGGKQLVPPDKAGLDGITLQLMTMESHNYSDVERRALLQKTSADIGAVDGLDFSQYYLTVIDMYAEEVFDLYADLLLHPVFREDLFAEVVTNRHNAYRAELTDGFARVSQAVNTLFFAGHPYAAHIYTPDTLSAISLDDVKQYYQSNVTAGHMALFAAGAIDIPRLRAMLETAFGSLPFETAPPAGDFPPFSPAQPCPLVLDACDALSPDAAYVRGNFATIAATHSDYWALQVASQMLSDLLSDLIRTRNSLVYSVWSTLYGRQTNYGTIAVYRTSDPVSVVDHIRYCIDVLASGRCLSPYAGSGGEEDRYVELARGLEYYKRSLSTGFYSGLQQSSSIARQMAASRMLTGNPADYLDILDRINRVSGEDVIRAARLYLRKAPLCWAVTAHPDVIARLRKNHSGYAAQVVEAGLP